MKRLLCLFLALFSLLLSSVHPTWARTVAESADERLRLSADVLKTIMAAPDKGIPEELLGSAKCMIVVPHLIKGGFLFGGKYGHGAATCRVGNGWSAPAFILVRGGSAGLQAGYEGIDLVMLIMNNQGLQRLLSSKFEITGEGSIAAGSVGRHASAGTDWKLNTEMLTYSRSKGLFAGLTLEGAVIENDPVSTRAVYQSKTPFRTILSGQATPPAGASEFMRALSQASHRAHEDESKEKSKNK